jgi:hypothetical protein
MIALAGDRTLGDHARLDVAEFLCMLRAPERVRVLVAMLADATLDDTAHARVRELLGIIEYTNGVNLLAALADDAGVDLKDTVKMLDKLDSQHHWDRKGKRGRRSSGAAAKRFALALRGRFVPKNRLPPPP